MIEEITNVACRIASIIGLYTADAIQLRLNATTPYALSIPIPAFPAGMTLAYYTRTPLGKLFGIYVDNSQGVPAAIDSYSVQGSWLGNFFVDGALYSRGPFTMYENNVNQWRLVVLRSTVASPAGSLEFNRYAGEAFPGNGLAGVEFAYLNVYDYQLTDAQIAAPMLPGNAAQQYVGAGYTPGDLVLVDQKGSGRDATLLY